ncbi:MAG: hypothetical protein ACP5JF_04590 [Candidatus Methanodesulfokora sp.]|jgi:hypothetical protein|nr:MAG: hypothetical protein C0200_05910 [Candidatus Korarchaeota archaeon]
MLMIFNPKEEKWRNIIKELVNDLQESLKDNLDGIIALPREEDEVYGSNVLILVKDDSLDTARRISKIIGKYGYSVLPMIATKYDGELVSSFMKRAV